ncbi:MAG TPA: Rnase Y domain-containing protein, partial [Solirubrobacteraceae bacterium]|nr:Rnase Y domain-containing protein [Solirubrobacteraceae bacterium]
MQGVLYAAVVAAFLLGIYFINSYRRRGMRAPVPASSASGDDDQLDVDSYAQSTRRVAEAEAASIRALAQREADAQRRAVEAELEALHRAAAADAATAKEVAERAHANAKAEAAMLLGDARAAAESEAARLTEEIRQTERDLVIEAERLADSQVALEAQAARIRDESAELDKAVQQLGVRGREQDDREADLDGRFAELEKRAVEHDRERERIAGLTAEEAKAELLASVEVGARRDAAMLVRSIENEARAEGTDRARAIVVEAVQRVASEQTAETVVSVLHLPSDEMKGRIIGREGRNIRTFESVTGVNVIIDDTPEAVLLSCFDPVRREVGRLTLDKLILDGRIHPHRIEEVYESSRTEVEELCLRAARDALADVGIGDLDESLLPT